MLRRIILLDIALLVLLCFGGYQLRLTWQSFWPMHQVTTIRPAAEPPVTLPVPVSRPPVNENWTEIPARNPFSFDRNDIDVVAPVEAVAVAVPTGPKPVLFGIMFLDNQRLALLSPGQPGNRSFRPMKAGESIDGWKVLSIAEKSTVVESNGVQQTLILNDPTAQLPRESVRTAPVGSAVTTSVGSQQSVAPPVASSSTNPAVSNAPALPPGTKTRTVQTPFGTRTFIDPIP